VIARRDRSTARESQSYPGSNYISISIDRVSDRESVRSRSHNGAFARETSSGKSTREKSNQSTKASESQVRLWIFTHPNAFSSLYLLPTLTDALFISFVFIFKDELSFVNLLLVFRILSRRYEIYVRVLYVRLFLTYIKTLRKRALHSWNCFSFIFFVHVNTCSDIFLDSCNFPVLCVIFIRKMFLFES